MFLLRSFLYFLFLSLLCIADTYFFFTYRSNGSHFLLAAFIAYLWYAKKLNLSPLFLLFLSTQFFIFYSAPLVGLLFFSSIMTLLLLAKEHLYRQFWQPALIAGFVAGLQQWIAYALGSMPENTTLYTAAIICATMVLTAMFSLKLSGGKTGQSLMPSA